ncbi:T9SS type B sorting domain-containing protein [Jejuia pallidilutea]|uniref:Internalin-like protein (LPXTG motif) Lmo0331 homolog n=1 Tax=Jejuia pallidilutea TaxID=504487 RepID=A0A090VN03_9FLAO|nr:T9SS type B sorting domain-containing protein [Jejuia pallidilutea]GAL65388.1 internalin-like protein (LPXTG motif) Lmo0331 homolog [Jejuia pallidilutea]GAL69451.1 internalin-like protein (LPXTG motif) Lmo0331 homolog [Jejuia pallidilutea]
MAYKLCLLLATILFLTFKGVSQNTFVPDDNFEQALIDLGFDTPPLDDVVPTANIINITSLTISNKNIQNLTGIEDFAALSQLFVQDNQLSSIDVSANSNLQIFWCFNNLLSVIDVSNNPNLISLRCEENNLTTLDLSRNSELNVLTCGNNNLLNLDVSLNTKLNRLICSNNNLTSLDLSKNPDLSQLSCDGNELNILDLSNNLKINILNCSNNVLNELDVSAQTDLIELNCSNNQLCYLNINNGNNVNITLIDFSGNTNLTCVIIDDLLNNRSTWLPLNYQDYVISIEECSSKVLVDNLEDFIGTSYILPPITNGNYFTATLGNGIPLTVGDEITRTQTIYIYNENGCFNNETSFSVIISDSPYFIPKYFTPNNDGTNDFWQVIDTNNSINTISIYNRFGKLVKFLPKTPQDGMVLLTVNFYQTIAIGTK